MAGSIIARYAQREYELDLDQLIDWNEVFSYQRIADINDPEVLDKLREIYRSTDRKTNANNLVELYKVPEAYDILRKNYRGRRGEDDGCCDLFYAIMRKYDYKIGKSFKYYLKKCLEKDADRIIEENESEMKSHYVYYLIKIGMLRTLSNIYAAPEELDFTLERIDYSDIVRVNMIDKIIRGHGVSHMYTKPIECEFSISNIVLLKYVVKNYPLIIVYGCNAKGISYLHKKLPNYPLSNFGRELGKIQQCVRQKRKYIVLTILRMILQKFTSWNMSKLILYHV